ncbi:hypothetical protein L211DRAFT_700578 [Terfezia boudieri ATCC MYA-4762]|uniref:Uncharacterized protein n=1 Tax=Terfezia boudieri ATCC MYA-4762 TaxID=1051890 RepID=A0A3N4M8F8_9PEZI|nr:hypothetical protein L211DRAFT_700578 [Terfezia boudieri ATCC MYA-4762]
MEVPVLKCSLQLRSGDTIPSNIPEQPSIQRSFCMITKSSLGIITTCDIPAIH